MRLNFEARVVSAHIHKGAAPLTAGAKKQTGAGEIMAPRFVSRTLLTIGTSEGQQTLI